MKTFPIIVTLLTALLFVAGCESPPPAGQDSLAWVEISGRTPAEIRQATADVFRENDYRLKTSFAAEAIFERPGSAMNNLAYGGWDSGVTIRVVVRVNVQGNGTQLLHCQVFMVRNAGDRSVEETQKIYVGRGPYQDLLNRVKAKLLL